MPLGPGRDSVLPLPMLELVEVVLLSLLFVLEFVPLRGALPGCAVMEPVLAPVELLLPAEDSGDWAMAKGLRAIDRAGMSRKAKLFFMLLAPFLWKQIARQCARSDRLQKKMSGVFPRRSL